MDTSIQPANVDRWSDVTQVMGANGAYGGCWCMFWRLTNQEINANTADDNRAALQSLAHAGEHAGLILYASDEPIGWCSVAPRPAFPRLFHTKGIKPEDPGDASVWSVVCVFVKKGHRGGGVAGRLLDAAVAYAREHGASVIEGYPVADPNQGRKSGLSSGTIGLFTRARFTLHDASPTGRRVVMRRTL